MAGRYGGWYHKKFAATVPGWLQKIGEVVLGRVAERQRRSGMGVVDEVVRLPDGSMIRATIRGQQPVLELVWSGEGGQPEACTLYMESGVLDLGTNGAATPAATPTFTAGAKLLHFGELVDCEALGGLNGEVRYNATTIASQCMGGDPVEAQCLAPVLTDTVSVSRQDKINAQARVPAAMFSGLLRKYVQAHYGCPASAYTNPTGTDRLRIYRPDGTWFEAPPHIASGGGANRYSVGIAYARLRYYFLKVLLTGTVQVYPVVFTPCGEVLRKVLASGLAGERGDKGFDRLEAYLFTQMLPADESQVVELTVTAAGATDQPIAFGWHFNSDGSAAAIATYTNTARSVYVLDFGVGEDGAPHAAITLADSVARSGVPNSLGTSLYIAGSARSAVRTSIERGDYPLYCWYDAGDVLRVVRSNFVSNPSGNDRSATISGCMHMSSSSSTSWQAWLDGYEGRTGLDTCAAFEIDWGTGDVNYRASSFYVPGLWSESLVTPSMVSATVAVASSVLDLSTTTVGPGEGYPVLSSTKTVVPQSVASGYEHQGCSEYDSWAWSFTYGPPIHDQVEDIDRVRNTIKAMGVSTHSREGQLALLVPMYACDMVYVYRAWKWLELSGKDEATTGVQLVEVRRSSDANVEQYVVARRAGTTAGSVLVNPAGGYAGEGADSLRAYGSQASLETGVEVFSLPDSFGAASYEPAQTVPCAMAAPRFSGVHAPNGVKYLAAGASKASDSTYSQGAYGTGDARQRLPAWASAGGHHFAYADLGFDLEVVNRPLQNSAAIAADIRNPSFVGWA